jgi:tetrahydromethanopterin S-methyltransferase subunit G
MEYQIKLHERLAKVEEKVDQIMENHLPHIIKKVDALGAKFWAIILLLLSTLIGVIANYLK